MTSQEETLRWMHAVSNSQTGVLHLREYNFQMSILKKSYTQNTCPEITSLSTFMTK